MHRLVAIVAVALPISVAWMAGASVIANEPKEPTEERAQEKASPSTPAKKPPPDPMIGTEAGQIRDDNGLKMKLVWCPPGVFMMDQHVRVLLTRGYWLSKYEVTQAEWKQIMATEPWKGQRRTNAGPDFPATYVSLDDAMDFCRTLTEREHKTGRHSNDWQFTLPTEAQWERACRARTETIFSFGNEESKLDEFGWYVDNASRVDGQQFPHRVGQKKPNPWGFCDTHGNVLEWCRDAYSPTLPGGRDPVVTEARNTFVLRGGSWTHQARMAQSSFRSGSPPNSKSSDLGFRVALVPVRPANAPAPSAEPAP